MAFTKIVILTLAVTLCSCEPPVRNYHSQFAYNQAPAHQPGYNQAPSHNSGYNYNAPNNAYIPPSYPSAPSFAGPSNNYNAPSFGVNPPATGFTPPVIGHGSPAFGHGTPGSGYGTPAFGHGSQGTHGHGNDNGHGHDNEEPKSYEFGYTVKDAASGNDYGRREVSDGDTVRGEYRVALPDGRTQIVTYHADWRTGFHADVRYEGEARYPDQSQSQYQHQQPAAQHYNYNPPSFGGSLSGFHGNANSAQRPTNYGSSRYH